jgi:hypothetical protein
MHLDDQIAEDRAWFKMTTLHGKRSHEEQTAYYPGEARALTTEQITRMVKNSRLILGDSNNAAWRTLSLFLLDEFKRRGLSMD